MERRLHYQRMTTVLVHHADAVGPEVDPQRPLSSVGLRRAQALAERVHARGFVPEAIWHSGKLRARQTAEPFWRLCNPFAAFKMVRGLSPGDPPEIIRTALLGDSRAILLVSHMPLLPSLLQALTGGESPFPLHGAVALESHGDGSKWMEIWREQSAPGTFG
jgi:phosphohistidine phosphatase